MSRSLLACFFVAFLLPIALAAEPNPESDLEKEIRVPSNLGISTNISEDMQAATVLFDNQTAVQTKVTTINVPYTTDQRSVTMTMDLRGFLNTEPGATARLVACVGDKTEVVDLSADKDKKIALKGKCKQAVIEENPDTELHDWQDRIEFTVQTHAAKPVVQISLFLLVEHDTDTADAGGALLVVDSIDLEIAKSAKAAYKK